ncbi:MAG TPA: Ref family recombination enhancement nuclease [Candidatus Paceibacterota bacterium]
MKHSTKAPTKAEQMRFEAIKIVGCIPCWLNGVSFNPCAIHHVVKGRKRLGHRHTYGNCDWHHQGYPLNGKTTKESEEIAGPSLARSPRAYHERFGSEEELVTLCDEMIKPYIENWTGEYS